MATDHLEERYVVALKIYNYCPYLEIIFTYAIG